MATPKDLPRDVGEFIRDLRRNAKISLRQLAEQTGVSNPYLSQIERGLRKPSAEVLQQLASALRVSTPAMYLRAGLLDDREGQGVLAAIAVDPDLTMSQKQSLSQIYETFRRENLRHAESAAEQPMETGPAAEQQVNTGPAAEQPTATGPVVEQPAEAGPVVEQQVETGTVVGRNIDTGDPAAAVLESVAVTETGAAAPPNQPSPTRPVKKTARRVVRKAADAVEEEK